MKKANPRLATPTGELLFGLCCTAPDTEHAVAALSLANWQTLYGWLLRNYSENGISGQLLGLMFVNGAARLAGGKP